LLQKSRMHEINHDTRQASPKRVSIHKGCTSEN
jgi:hypothetical protein